MLMHKIKRINEIHRGVSIKYGKNRKEHTGLKSTFPRSKERPEPAMSWGVCEYADAYGEAWILKCSTEG